MHIENFLFAFTVSLLVACPLRAQNFVGDTYVDFETGSDGTPITAALVTSATRGSTFSGWRVSRGSDSFSSITSSPNLIVSAAASYPMTSPVNINGTNYSGGTRGLRAVLSENNIIELKLPSPGLQLSIGFHFRFNGPQINYSPRDVAALRSDPTGNYQFLQIYDGPSPYFHAHWQPGGSGIGNNVNFSRNRWYWVTMVHVAGGNTTKVSYYDPANNYSLIGTSTGAVSSGTTGCTAIQFGSIKYSAGGSQSVDFDNIVISKSGNFPLVPGPAIVNPPPAAPTNLKVK